MRMNMLTVYYYKSAHILKEYLPCIPELKLTNAKTYCGRIYKSGGRFRAIALSKWNLDCGPISWWDKEDIEELIDTIAHEFAHMTFWEHGERHSELTNAYKEVILSQLEIERCENILNQIA